MTHDVQSDYETRVNKLTDAFLSFDGLGSQVTIYHLLLKQYREKGDHLWRIEPLLYVFIKSLETNLHVSLARLLEPKNRSHGNFEKFLSFCKANATKIVWKEGTMTIELIEAQEAELSAHSKTIEAIKARRDKRFAHSDRAYFENADQIMEDYPLKEGHFVDLANCIIGLLHVHENGLKPNTTRIGMHIFNEISVDNMVRNLEAGRRLNFPNQLE